MLRKIIILEIIVVVIVSAAAYSFYGEYSRALEENQAAADHLNEVRMEESRIEKEYRQLDEEIAALKESVDLKILEIWKRRVAQLQEELE
ncbi:MAG: hypothetical protein IKF80_04880 [Erysipelotrichaceae bacterium]|nr:hypothetical protein [Erysipelotrichaceae bacterium]